MLARPVREIPPVTRRWRRRLGYLLAAVVAIAVGLLFRAPFMELPYPVAKYGGSILWAGMVYFGLRALFPSPRAVRVAVFAAILTALGELTQLVSMPGFDELRATPIGHLMFGRTFDWPDIAAYWIGIGLAAAGDALVLRSHK